MAYQGRLHVPQRYYLVREDFRPGSCLLVPDPRDRANVQNTSQIDARRTRYESLLAYASNRWRVAIQLYCWLPDSAYLLVRIRYAPLEWFMHSLRSPFSHYLQRTARMRRPYAGRYHALLIDDQEFLADVVRYMLLLPQSGGLTSNALEYQYGGAGAFRGRTPPFIEQPALLNVAAAMRMPVRRFLNERPRPGFQTLVAGGSRHDRRVLGRPDFVRSIRGEARKPAPRAAARPCIEWVAARLGLRSVEILERRRWTRAVEARALTGWLVSCAGAAKLSTVARWFATDRSSLERSIDDRCHRGSMHFNDDTLDEFHQFLCASASGIDSNGSCGNGCPAPRHFR